MSDTVEEEDTFVTPAEVSDAVNKYLELDPEAAPVFTVKAPVNLSILEEKGWRTRMVDGGQEFLLKAIRPGKKRDFVITFEPMDTRPYKVVEVTDDRIEVLAENVANFLSEAVGYKDTPWKTAKLKFFKERRRERATAKAAEEAKAKKEAENFYTDDPLFGLF